MADFGSRILQVGSTGSDVIELQVRLSGFGGGVPTGTFDNKLKRAVMKFQRYYMKSNVSGVFDRKTFDATDTFALAYPIFTTYSSNLQCPCNSSVCIANGRYGHNDNAGVYRNGEPNIEAYHKKEYLGMHRCLLWAVRGVFFWVPEYSWTVNSGYRSRVDNVAKGRKSTNHMGKAIDIDPGTRLRCDIVRRRSVSKMGAQIGWNNSNKISFEPSSIAPTWVHLDVRTFDQAYLTSNYFVTNETDLNNGITHTLTEQNEEENEEPLIDAQEEIVQVQEARVFQTTVHHGPPSDPSPCNLSTSKSSTKTFNKNKDDGWIDIAKGIYNYVTTSTNKNYELKATTTGSVILPAGPVAVPADQLDVSIYFNTEASLLSSLKTLTYSGIDSGGIGRFFNAFNQWVNTPPFTIGLSRGINASVLTTQGITLTPSDTGTAPGLHGMVTFPAVVQQGIACQNEMSRTTFPEDTKLARRKSWDIMNKYIKLALNLNVIAPIPTAGTAGANSYVGVTTVLYSYK